MKMIVANRQDLKEAAWTISKGKFSTWMVGDFYWHGPTKFNISNKVVSIFCEDVDRIPEKKVWYLRGLRQHIWRRYRKIKGFIPFIGMDIVNSKIVFVLYQVGPKRSNLYLVLQSFLESEAHTNLKNRVHF